MAITNIPRGELGKRLAEWDGDKKLWDAVTKLCNLLYGMNMRLLGRKVIA